MHLVSVNAALPTLVGGTTKGTVKTAIFKTPVRGPVMVRRLNLDGDGQGDLKHHGGPDQAVYAYALEDYGYWEETLGRTLPNYGWFGENLTMEGASSDTVYVQDVLRVGEALLQVTEPRWPCFKLEHKMGIPKFAARFSRSGRLGFYLRVLEEGPVQAGDAITIVSRDSDGVSIRSLGEMRLFREGPLEEAERALRVEGLHPVWRKYAAKRLERQEHRVP